MTIDVEQLFPNNVVILIADRLSAIDNQIQVYRRPIKTTDANLAVGVYASGWTPVADSFEIRNSRPGEPTIQNYTYEVVVSVKDTEEERGLALVSTIAAHVRAVLVRDSTLSVVLSQLQVTSLGMRERVQHWKVERQRFISAEYQRSFYYMGLLDFVLQTETVPNI